MSAAFRILSDAFGYFRILSDASGSSHKFKSQRLFENKFPAGGALESIVKLRLKSQRRYL